MVRLTCALTERGICNSSKSNRTKFRSISSTVVIAGAEDKLSVISCKELQNQHLCEACYNHQKKLRRQLGDQQQIAAASRTRSGLVRGFLDKPKRYNRVGEVASLRAAVGQAPAVLATCREKRPRDSPKPDTAPQTSIKDHKKVKHACASADVCHDVVHDSSDSAHEHHNHMHAQAHHDQQAHQQPTLPANPIQLTSKPNSAMCKQELHGKVEKQRQLLRSLDKQKKAMATSNKQYKRNEEHWKEKCSALQVLDLNLVDSFACLHAAACCSCLDLHLLELNMHWKLGNSTCKCNYHACNTHDRLHLYVTLLCMYCMTACQLRQSGLSLSIINSSIYHTVCTLQAIAE